MPHLASDGSLTQTGDTCSHTKDILRLQTTHYPPPSQFNMCQRLRLGHDEVAQHNTAQKQRSGTAEFQTAPCKGGNATSRENWHHNTDRLRGSATFRDQVQKHHVNIQQTCQLQVKAVKPCSENNEGVVANHDTTLKKSPNASLSSNCSGFDLADIADICYCITSILCPL